MAEHLTCKTCGQAYEFVETVSGKMMPINIEPTAAGNIIVVDGKADVLKKGDPRWESVPAEQRRLSHFASCPYARDYRKRHPVVS